MVEWEGEGGGGWKETDDERQGGTVRSGVGGGGDAGGEKKATYQILIRDWSRFRSLKEKKRRRKRVERRAEWEEI